MDFQKYKGKFSCTYKDHIGEPIFGVCLNCQCTKNIPICEKCMHDYHNSHVEDCVHIDFLQDFLNSGINNLRLALENFKENILFTKFFKRKLELFQQAKYDIENLQKIKENVNIIQLAYNLLNFQKQFVMGCYDIEDKEIMKIQLESIFEENNQIHLDECQQKINKFQSQFLYKFSIQCCDRYLRLKSYDYKILLQKGYNLHMLDRLEEAEKIYKECYRQQPRDPEVCSLLFMLFEGQDIEKIPIYEYQNCSQYMNSNLKQTIGAKKMVESFRIWNKDELIKLLNSILQENPTNYIAISLQGQCYLKSDQYEQANQSLKEAEKIYPLYKQTLHFKAQLLVQENKKDDVLGLINRYPSKFSPLDKAVILSPMYTRLYDFKEVEKLIDQVPLDQRYKQQFKDLQIQSRINSNNYKWESDLIKDRHQSMLAKAHEHLYKLELQQALDILNNLHSENKQNPQGWKLKILTLYALNGFQQQSSWHNQMELVRQAFKEFYDISPNCKEIIELTELIPFIKDLYQSYKNDNPNSDSIENQYKKAENFLSQNQNYEALKIYRQILSKDARQNQAKFGEIKCMILIKQEDEALKFIEDLEKYYEDKVKVLLLKSFAYYNKQEYQKCLNILNDIEKINPNYYFLKRNQAQCLYKMEKFREAKFIYESLALKFNDDFNYQQYKVKIFKTIFASRYQNDQFQTEVSKEQECFLQRDMLRFQKEQNSNYGVWLSLILNENQDRRYRQMAIKQIQKIEKLMPFCEIFIFVHAEILIKSNLLQEAIKLHEKIYSKNKDYVLTLVRLSQLWKNLNSDSKSGEFKEKALKINKDSFNEKILNKIMIDELEKYFERIKFYIEDFEVENEKIADMINIYF